MAASQAQQSRRETIEIPMKSEDCRLLDLAAKAQGKSRTDFILEAARVAAEEVLLDRTTLVVGPVAYAEFLARLDAPSQSNERLRRTMLTPSPWEEA